MFDGNKNCELANIKKYCSSKDDLYKCLRHCAEHHTSYKIYYSDYKIFEKIIKNKNLILRNDGYNDKIDENNIKNESDGFKKFILCFTFSISENVAMWIIYGKKNNNNQFGKSVMVSYTKEMLKSIIEYNVEIEYGIFENNKFVNKGKTDKFDIEMCDVIYYSLSKENDKYDIKKGDSIYKCDKNIIDSMPCVKKFYPWSYENECRMIVKIKSNFLDSNINAVRLLLDDNIIKQMKEKCICSPLYQNNKENDNIKLRDSSLKNQLNFN